MTKKEYTVDEPFELTATPISWLEGIPKNELSADDILLVVSQPNYQVQDTGYISKKAKLIDIKDSISESLGIDALSAQMSEMQSELTVLNDISAALNSLNPGGEVTLNGSISDPYLLSSISFSNGNITEISGFKLRDSLSAILPSTVYSRLKATQLSCTTLIANGQTFVPVGQATASTLGTVKIDNEKPETAAAAYVRMDEEGKLYVNISQVKTAIENALVQEVTSRVLSNISNKYFETVVAQTRPPVLSPKTIYYIVNPDL